MNYEELKSLMSLSTSIKLLRAKSAPIILSFLHREFKANNRIAIAGYELTNNLADYLESLEDKDLLDIEISDSLSMARHYLSQWCNEENRYLTRYPDENGEALHELTSQTEKALQWMDSLRKREFVGTESRFRNIYRQLQELIDNTSEDPRKKIKELEKKRKAITKEINAIKKTGIVETYNDTQIKERFFNITKTARELTSDFKEVEQNFKDITLNLYKKQTQTDVNKGQILGYALDATDELKNSDQGKSFYAFWQFLIADNKQDELMRLIDYTYQLLKDRDIKIADNFLRKIKIYLHNSGQKVIDSNHLLADKLSRILSERNVEERERTREVINEIKNLAVRKIGKFKGKKDFISIEGTPEVNMSLDRPLGQPRQIAKFDKQPEAIGSKNYDSANLDALFDRFELDKQEIQNKIKVLLKDKSEISLADILKIHPIENGLAEIITYVSIASRNQKHRIDSDKKVAVAWKNEEEEAQKKIMLPNVIFVR